MTRTPGRSSTPRRGPSCKALRKLGYRIVLTNSNPATSELARHEGPLSRAGILARCKALGFEIGQGRPPAALPRPRVRD